MQRCWGMAQPCAGGSLGLLQPSLPAAECGQLGLGLQGQRVIMVIP